MVVQAALGQAERAEDDQRGKRQRLRQRQHLDEQARRHGHATDYGHGRNAEQAASPVRTRGQIPAPLQPRDQTPGPDDRMGNARVEPGRIANEGFQGQRRRYHPGVNRHGR
jgi:hypothetical protein